MEMGDNEVDLTTPSNDLNDSMSTLYLRNEFLNVMMNWKLQLAKKKKKNSMIRKSENVAIS